MIFTLERKNVNCYVQFERIKQSKWIKSFDCLSFLYHLGHFPLFVYKTSPDASRIVWTFAYLSMKPHALSVNRRNNRRRIKQFSKLFFGFPRSVIGPENSLHRPSRPISRSINRSINQSINQSNKNQLRLGSSRFPAFRLNNWVFFSSHWLLQEFPSLPFGHCDNFGLSWKTLNLKSFLIGKHEKGFWVKSQRRVI